MLKAEKSKFALFIGNRGSFPAPLLDAARQDMLGVLGGMGHEALALDASLTRHGGGDTAGGPDLRQFPEARMPASTAASILCLPNFGDETGAVAALKDAGVPILVQAYPDELDKMAPAMRRDAFCGKFSIMDVFHQYRRAVHRPAAAHRPP